MPPRSRSKGEGGQGLVGRVEGLKEERGELEVVRIRGDSQLTLLM